MDDDMNWSDPMPLPVPPSIFQMDLPTVIKGLREMAKASPRGRQREWWLDAAECVEQLYYRGTV
jgi:hypothetical protein